MFCPLRRDVCCAGLQGRLCSPSMPCSPALSCGFWSVLCLPGGGELFSLAVAPCVLCAVQCCARCDAGVFGDGKGLLGRAGADRCVDVDVFRVGMGS